MLGCFRHPVLFRRFREIFELSSLGHKTELKNTRVLIRSPKLCIAEKKISLNVSCLLVNPACMAGVLTSRPNFNAVWGLTKL